MAYNEFEISEKELDGLTKNEDSAKYLISSLLRANAQDENDAMRKYYQLLTYLTDEDDIAQIKEIISDEKNHEQILNKLDLKYSGIKPAIT